jgi:hypothetical protein
MSWLIRAPLLLALACATRSQVHPPERVALAGGTCSELPSCFELLERSSELAAHEHAEERLAGFGAAAIPHLTALVEQGDAISKYRAAGALGRIAARHPGKVLAAAGAVLHERCAGSVWSACWALAQAGDRSVYPLLARHLKAGVDAGSLLDGRAVPAAVAEWFIVELEDRAASGALHAGVLDVFHRAEGAFSAAAAAHLHQLLQAELPSELGRVPAGYPCYSSAADCWSRVDRAPDAGQCPASFSACWARLDYLVTALGLCGPAAVQAREDIRTVWQSTPAPHSYIAREALARMGDRSIVPSLLAELAPLDRRALEHLRLLGKQARPELPQLLALFQRAPGNERAALLEIILAIGGPLAVQLGIEGLRNPADDGVAVLKGLLKASGESSAHAALRGQKVRLEELATRSASRQVRQLASELLVAIGFAAPAAPAPACPVIEDAFGPEPRAGLARGTVQFQRLESPAVPAGECAGGGMPRLRVGEECLRGHSQGEFGYQITIQDGQTDQPRGRVRGVGLNPARFLRYGEQLLIIEALAHGMGHGNIDRLVRDSDGHWLAHRFTTLPGVPVGYTFDAERQLLLLVSGNAGDLCHAENGGWQVLRVGTDGTLEPLH